MLIVDDNEADRYIATRVAQKSGEFDHVYTLNDGEEAYLHFKDEVGSKKIKGDFFPPTVVVLDVNMPRMSGFDFLEKYKELPISKNKNIFFVAMLTSSEDSGDKKKAFEFSSVRAFLTKPFKRESIDLILEQINEFSSGD